MSIEPKTISRRSFIGASTAVAASIAALSGVACAKEATIEENDGIKGALPEDPAAGGTWVNASCWHNCGGRCMNKVMVKDGIVIRQKTDDTHEDSFDYPQQRGCVRGKAQQQQCFGADRILRPLKRKGWKPGGGANANGAMRGKDEWEVISWEEAIKYCCDEALRIKGESGGGAFLFPDKTGFSKVLGTEVASWETSSMGTYQFGVNMFGLPMFGMGMANDRHDMLNADTIVMYSSNPVWSAAGTPIYHYIRAKEAGVKFVTVDPIYNASAQTVDAEWLPVRCGTDMAFLLGVAYEMLRLDEERGNIIDWDFLHKYCVGFDAESMPADAKLNENLKDYILGKYDNTPKTPEWAYTICGVPVEQITAFAEMMGKQNNVMVLHNFAFARNHGTEQIAQMLMAVCCMGAHIGKSGNCYGSAYHADCGNAGPSLVSAGGATGGSLKGTVKKYVHAPELWKLILAGGGTFTNVGNAAYGAFAPEVKQDTIGEIRFIGHGYEAGLQTSLSQKDHIAAHRKVDFVMTIAMFMTTNARYSDIILPVTTEWERPGGVAGSNREFVFAYKQVTEPLGEAKSDQEIDELLIKGLGEDPTVAYPINETQAYYEQVATTTYLAAGGEYKPLVTITAEDIKAWGVKGEAQEGIISLAEFVEKGGYQVKRSANDGHGFIGFADFIKDPEANPLPSASGKFEIYCQAHDDALQSFKYANHEAYKPYPVYIETPAPVGYAATFANNDIAAGVKGEFPYLLYNPHYIRRSHSVFDNCPWLRESWPNPVFISTADAKAEGIATGDTVLITSHAGSVLRKAAVIDIIRPGVVGLPHGAWVDVDEATGIDKAGSDNYLIGDERSGMGVSGYNNCTCKIEKYNGAALADDCMLPPRWSEN